MRLDSKIVCLASRMMLLSGLIFYALSGYGLSQEMNLQQTDLILSVTLREVDESNWFIVYYDNRLLKVYADKELCQRMNHFINKNITVRYEYRTDDNHVLPPRTYLFAIEAVESK